MNEGSVNVVLTRSIIHENATDLAQVADIVLDVALENDVLKEIPIVSLIVKAFGIGRGIRDRIFLKKLLIFLSEATKISPEERKDFSKRLDNEPRLAESCGESALLLLDKLSSIGKARLMGYAFRLFVRGVIDDFVLHRIYAALEFMPLWQLIALPEYYFDYGLGSLNQSDAGSYQRLWFIEIFYGDKGERLHFDSTTGESFRMSYQQPFYRPTDLGKQIAEVIRDYLNEPD
jgi:hypothetical protein